MKPDKYLEALKSLIGEDKMFFAINLISACVDTLGKSGLRALENCESNSARLAFLEKKFGSFLPKEIKNFIVLLASENRLEILSDILKVRDKNNISVTLPRAIDAKTESWLADSIFKITGKNDVKFNFDSALLGGIRIKIGSTEIDNSVQSKLLAFQNT